MSEWKEIPGRWVTDSEDIEYKVQFNIEKNSHITLYRKTEPKATTHEEIMSKWWKHNNGVWFKVLEYDSEKNSKSCYLTNYEYNGWEQKNYFTNRESATIPPEAL